MRGSFTSIQVAIIFARTPAHTPSKYKIFALVVSVVAEYLPGVVDFHFASRPFGMVVAFIATIVLSFDKMDSSGALFESHSAILYVYF